MKRRSVTWFIVIWLAAMLFPLGWASQRDPNVHIWFDRLFSPEWVHVIMHLLLFAVLTGVVWNLAGRRNVIWVPVLVLGVGLVQEFIQLYFKQKLFGWPEIFDLGVDLAGGAIGLLVTVFIVRWQRKKTPPQAGSGL